MKYYRYPLILLCCLAAGLVTNIIAGLIITAIEVVPVAMAQATPPNMSSAEQAKELVNKAFALYREGKIQEAPELLRKAIELYRGAEDYQGEAETHVKLGSVYSAQGKYRQALKYYWRAVAIFREQGNRSDEGRTIMYIGMVYFHQSQYDIALEFYRQTLEIAQETGDRTGEGGALSLMGGIYMNRGQSTLALHIYQQALELAVQENDEKGKGRVLISIGSVYVSLGQYLKAIQSYRESLPILRKGRDHEAESIHQISIGINYARLGDYSRASEHLQEAIEILERIQNPKNKATALTNIGAVYEEWGNSHRLYYLKALGIYEQALKIQDQITDPMGKGITLNNIGKALDRLGWDTKVPTYHRQALKYYRDSQEIIEEITTKALLGKILNNIGEAYLHLSAYENKTEHLKQALDVLRQALKNQDEIDEQAKKWKTLENIGRVFELQEKFREALDAYKQSIEILESIIENARLGEFKISLEEQAITAYQQIILLLIHMEKDEEAFEFSERARARAFLDQLGNTHPDIQHKADEGFLQQKRTLQRELKDLEQRLRKQYAQSEAQQDIKLIEDLKRQIAERRKRYEDLLLDMKLSNPEYTSLVRIAPLRLNNVQNLLDEEITLLSYFVTTNETLAFVITEHSFKTLEIPVGKKELEQKVRKVRQAIRANELSPQALKDLYKLLIIPLKKHLSTAIVGIIPHRTLHYLPFSALTDGQRYFSDEYILFSLPNASVLKFLQKNPKSGDSLALAMANDQKTEGFSLLHYVDQEVNAIAKFHKTQILIGKGASESALKKLGGNFSILHLAAHAELNTSNPLFSRILLSPDQENDGALEVHEVYDLNLQQAGLVVLSACDTLLGKQSQGDDIIGLTRAFMFAGTPSVIASLWKVDDLATSDFMKVFYKYLKRGKSKAEALQIARRKTRAKYPHPYYWAAFVLTGDPGSTPQHFSWVYTAIFILVITGIGLITRKKLFRV